MRLARAGTVVLLAVLAAACDKARTGETVTQDATASCTRCHGYPPPPNGPFLMPTTKSHPVSSDCHLCHPHTVEADNVTIIPASAGGQHMDGVVEATGGHPAGYADPAQHGPDALAFLGGSGTLRCTTCHGTDFAGGSSGKSCTACHAAAAPAPGFADWQTNCTFCHGTKTPGWTRAQLTLAAPPEAVVGSGDQTSANPKVGAHQAHLVAGPFSNALPCSSCHVVPTDALGHFAGYAGGQATITFDALATHDDATAAYAGSGGGCTVYCHGSGTVGTDSTTVKFAWPTGSVAADKTIAWTASGLTCTSCHGNPPTTGQHTLHVTSTKYPALSRCTTCHNGYTATTVDKTTHPDGTRDVVVTRPTGGTVRITGWDCTTCHGVSPVLY